MKLSLFFIAIFSLIGCKTSNYNQIPIEKERVFLWHFKDLTLDSIPGISLEKWYNENKLLKPKNEIIVAVLDTQIDLNHEDLQGQLWTNKKEIPNNGIDDDKNGYVDDLNGWNFVGHDNNTFTRYGKFEYTRILQFKEDYINLNLDQKNDSSIYYKEILRAEKKFNEEKKYYTNWKKSLDFLDYNWKIIEDTINYFFENKIYTIKQIDSLYKLYKINDKTFKERRNNNDMDLGALLSYKLSCLKSEYLVYDDIKKSIDQIDSILNRNLNMNINDRININEKINFLEKGYGNNRLNENHFQIDHNTSVSSIIAAIRNNTIGTRGFHQNIKIMPLSTSISGDEHDKDIAMAIYYAVDNGAKIINMSFGKEFSFNQKWVSDAFKYAEKNNILIIHSSGNNGFNVDENSYYPSDIDYIRKNKTELVSNFINVGSISKRTESTIVSPFSNYGKQNVDIFAPGEDIYVAMPDNEYEHNSGTSFAAPMVSGTAALIWLYYPNLTVQEVKNIILESGVVIDKMVIKPGTDDEMIHFSELCKTGKILNTYNAMQMAKEVSKKKK